MQQTVTKHKLKHDFALYKVDNNLFYKYAGPFSNAFAQLRGTWDLNGTAIHNTSPQLNISEQVCCDEVCDVAATIFCFCWFPCYASEKRKEMEATVIEEILRAGEDWVNNQITHISSQNGYLAGLANQTLQGMPLQGFSQQQVIVVNTVPASTESAPLLNSQETTDAPE